MVRIEVVGLEPPCQKCNELLENAKKAAKDAGVDAEVVKLWILSEDVRACFSARRWSLKVLSSPRERYINRNGSLGYCRVRSVWCFVFGVLYELYDAIAAC
jgi:hypothetical protein